MAGLTANGTDVGHYATGETAAEFYGYEELTQHQAQGLVDAGVMNQDGERSTFIYLHENTGDGTFDLGIHHFTGGGDSTQLQAQVVFNNFSTLVRETGFVLVEGVGIDRTAHGDTSYVFAENAPVRNAGGGSFVFESGTSVTPASARTLVQDEPEDETATGLSADSYLVNSEGDPVTKHLYDGTRGDGGVFAVNQAGQTTVTFEMQLLDDGRDDGQPVPDQWVIRGPNGTVTDSISGPGDTLDVEVDTT